MEVQREKPRMCADCNERITLCEQSDLLMANLARVAKAVVAVEDRRADIPPWTMPPGAVPLRTP